MAATFRNLIDEVGMMLGLSTDPGSEEETSIKWYVNAVGREIARSFPWKECGTETFVLTTAPYDTGTVAVTQDSTSVVGTGTSWSGFTDRKFAIGYADPWRRISANASPTALTLARAYREDTVTGQSYVVFQDEYDLDTTLRAVEAIEPMSSTSPGELEFQEQNGFDERTILPWVAGAPRSWGWARSTTNGVLRIRISPVPDDVYELRVKGLRGWTELVADGDLHIFGADFDTTMILGAALWAQRIGGNGPVTVPAEVEAMIVKLWRSLQPKKDRVIRRQAFDAKPVFVPARRVTEVP